MNENTTFPKTLLTERIKQNFDEFKADIIKMDSASVFELAPTITAVNDVYFYMTTHDWLDDGEAEYLMKWDNPLKILAAVWKEYSEDRGRQFGNMLDKIVENCDEDYTADSFSDEYGEDNSLDAEGWDDNVITDILCSDDWGE